MVRNESDIVGEDVEDVRRGRLDSKVRGVAIVQNRYLLSAITLVRFGKAYIDQSPITTQHIKGPTLGSLIHHSKRLFPQYLDPFRSSLSPFPQALIKQKLHRNRS
jgi:hypothetical protein